MSTNPSRTETGPSQHPGSIVGPLVADAASAEMHGDVAEAAMFASEAAHVAGAPPRRRREFAAVRSCARDALRRIGVAGAPILPDADRVPRWPAGVVGSLTHCEGYRAAAVAPADELAGIGIDAELHEPLPAAAAELVLRDEERATLRTLAEAQPAVHWDLIAFCAKEAVFKAWFPLTRRWLEFAEVSVTVCLDGTFAARLLVQDDRGPGAFTGRWTVAGGLVVAATSVGGSASR